MQGTIAFTTSLAILTLISAPAYLWEQSLPWIAFAIGGDVMLLFMAAATILLRPHVLSQDTEIPRMVAVIVSVLLVVVELGLWIASGFGIEGDPRSGLFLTAGLSCGFMVVVVLNALVIQQRLRVFATGRSEAILRWLGWLVVVACSVFAIHTTLAFCTSYLPWSIASWVLDLIWLYPYTTLAPMVSGLVFGITALARIRRDACP